MPSNRELAEIALSGRWIKAGSMWLDQNTPCTIRQAVEGITSIMPFTIRGNNGTVANRTQLARHVVSIYCGGLNKDLNFVIPRIEKSKPASLESLIYEEIKAGGPVESRDFLIKHASTMLFRLKSKGALLKLGRIYYIEGQDPATHVKRPRPTGKNLD